MLDRTRSETAKRPHPRCIVCGKPIYYTSQGYWYNVARNVWRHQDCRPPDAPAGGERAQNGTAMREVDVDKDAEEVDV